MANGREYTAHQRKIINRYYDQIDTIVLTRLSEISTDMILAMGDPKKLDRLWGRAQQAIEKITPKGEEIEPRVQRIFDDRDIEAFGQLVSKLSK